MHVIVFLCLCSSYLLIVCFWSLICLLFLLWCFFLLVTFFIFVSFFFVFFFNATSPHHFLTPFRGFVVVVCFWLVFSVVICVVSCYFMIDYCGLCNLLVYDDLVQWVRCGLLHKYCNCALTLYIWYVYVVFFIINSMAPVIYSSRLQSPQSCL